MENILESLEQIKPETLMVLIFAVILLIFLLVLIIITIRVLGAGNDEDEGEEEEYEEETPKSKKKNKNKKNKKSDDEEEDDSEEEAEEEDETSKMVAEAVASVEETKAKVEAEKARQAAEEALTPDGKTEVLTTPGIVAKKDKKTGKVEAVPIEEAAEEETAEHPDNETIAEELKKVREEAKESEEDYSDAAKERAEAPEYNASFDSAFVDRPVIDEDKPEPVIPNPTPESMAMTAQTLDASEEALAAEVKAARTAPTITVNPVNAVNINTVNSVEEVDTSNPEAGINSMSEMKEFMEENPEPKVKKRKVKKKDKVFEDKFGTHGHEIKTAKYFWYNTQDIEGLTRKEDMYFKCHYFEDPDEAILDLITEMYDCAFVRTEQLQRIAYGITFKSLGMKEILRSEENLGFNKDKATKEPTQSDKEEIYSKWCSYVDNFHKIVVINAPESVEEYMIEKMYEYGNRDVEELMYSPY